VAESARRATSRLPGASWPEKLFQPKNPATRTATTAIAIPALRAPEPERRAAPAPDRAAAPAPPPSDSSPALRPCAAPSPTEPKPARELSGGGVRSRLSGGVAREVGVE